MRKRFLALVADLGMGQNAFEMATGLVPGTICKMKHAVRADKLVGVIREYPSLNIKWLITGEGEMWDNKSHNNAPEPTNQELSWLHARIEAQERIIENLSKSISK